MPRINPSGFLAKFLEPHPNPYGLDVTYRDPSGKVTRINVESSADVLRLASNYWRNGLFLVSCNPHVRRNTPGALWRLVVDVDDRGSAPRIIDSIKSRIGCEPLAVLSRGKHDGVHLHLFLDACYKGSPEDVAEVNAALMVKIGEALYLDGIEGGWEYGPFWRPNACFRMPYTMNQRGLVEPCDPDTLKPISPGDALEILENLRPIPSSFIARAVEEAITFKAIGVTYKLTGKGKGKSLVRSTTKYRWIEEIEERSDLTDCRHRLLFRVLIPYYTTILGLTPEEAYSRARSWLDKQPDKGKTVSDSWLKSECKLAYNKKIMPMSLSRLLEESPELKAIIGGDK